MTLELSPSEKIAKILAATQEIAGQHGIEAVAKQTPVRRAGTPEDIAAACAFLCSEEAGYITGQQINVNGGWYL